MALPSGNEMQTQVLKSLQDQNAHTIIEVKESIAKRFNVSESERKKCPLNGHGQFLIPK